jgi:hypothetical protein
MAAPNGVNMYREVLTAMMGDEAEAHSHDALEMKWIHLDPANATSTAELRNVGNWKQVLRDLWAQHSDLMK